MQQKLFLSLRKMMRVLIDTWVRMRHVDMSILASSLAFSVVISLVPLLAVSLSVFKAYGGLDVLMQQIEPFIIENFVEASGAQASRFIRASLMRIETGALGVLGVFGLFLSSTKVFLDVEVSVRRVWNERGNRFQWKRLVVYWVVMFLGPLAIAVLLGLIGSKGLDLVKILPKKSIVVACVFFASLCINKFIPSAKVGWRPAVIAAGFTAVGIGLAQQFYAQITTGILRYNTIYGSLASIPVFLLWVFILCQISLAGVCLCATLERGPSKTPGL